MLVVVFKTGIALGTIFTGRAAAQSADGIPLGAFGAAGAEAVVALFALWGLSQVVLSAFAVLALTRYRAMIPLMYLLLLLEDLAAAVDPVGEAHRPHGQPARSLHQPWAARGDHRGPCAVAVAAR